MAPTETDIAEILTQSEIRPTKIRRAIAGLLFDGKDKHVTVDDVIDLARGADDIGDIAFGGGLVQQVIRINSDAMAADKAGLEADEIPFGGCGVDHLVGVDAVHIEDSQSVKEGKKTQLLCRFSSGVFTYEI